MAHFQGAFASACADSVAENAAWKCGLSAEFTHTKCTVYIH